MLNFGALKHGRERGRAGQAGDQGATRAAFAQGPPEAGAVDALQQRLFGQRMREVDRRRTGRGLELTDPEGAAGRRGGGGPGGELGQVVLEAFESRAFVERAQRGLRQARPPKIEVVEGIAVGRVRGRA